MGTLGEGRRKGERKRGERIKVHSSTKTIFKNELQNREFSTKESKMAKRHLSKCSAALGIREMQIKRTLRYHPAPFRTANNKNTNTAGGNASLKIGMVVSQKIGNQSTSGPSHTQISK